MINQALKDFKYVDILTTVGNEVEQKLQQQSGEILSLRALLASERDEFGAKETKLLARVLELEKALNGVSDADKCWCNAYLHDHTSACERARRALHQGEMNQEGE